MQKPCTVQYHLMHIIKRDKIMDVEVAVHSIVAMHNLLIDPVWRPKLSW